MMLECFAEVEHMVILRREWEDADVMHVRVLDLECGWEGEVEESEECEVECPRCGTIYTCDV